ncbi:MAG TPA: alpha/beta fold hydrolase [Rhizobacter sp.]|nr:alpha/beta fold hydrolase [Rhizobacter sp.]
MKRIASLAGIALASALACGQAAAQTEPIVFVHGYSGNSGNWSTMISRFTASGYPANKLYGFNYNSLLISDTASGAQLASYVSTVRARHGGEKVSIVAHSNGGLVSRAFRVFNGGTAQMRRFVTLGTPHLGTTTAYACFSPACYDMWPGSVFILSLAGRGCDRSLWSAVDGIIVPATNARCGSSTQVASVDHLSLLTNSSVYNSVRAALR